MLYLYIPMLILIICNWMFYLMTAFNVWRLSRGTAVLDSAAAGTPAAHRTQRNRSVSNNEYIWISSNYFFIFFTYKRTLK